MPGSFASPFPFELSRNAVIVPCSPVVPVLSERDWMTTKIIILLLLGIQLYEVGAQGSNTEIRPPKKKYEHLGDINIGVLTSFSKMSMDNICLDVPDDTLHSKQSELVAYAVEQFNTEHPLPHNLTLGFVILDDCGNQNVAVTHATAFVPQTSCSGSQEEQASYDVVGVIGAEFSVVALNVAHILAPIHIPQVSAQSNSEDLSDRSLYPYFLRVIPSQRHQLDAVIHLTVSNNWTYVSVIFYEGTLESGAVETLNQLFTDNEICVAVSYRIEKNFHDKELEAAATYLVENHGNSRVVVLILGQSVALRFVEVTERLYKDNFVWINTYGWSASAINGSSLMDSFVVNIRPAPVPGFNDWFQQLTPDKTSDPWFHDDWENIFSCSLDSNTCRANLTLADVDLPEEDSDSYAGYMADAVSIIANATARILHSTTCQNLTASEARACVTGPRLLSELMATRQSGYSGWLELDRSGDRFVPYIISHVKPNNAEENRTIPVMEFDPSTGQVTHLQEVTWDIGTLRPGSKTLESVCSFPCGKYEARAPHAVKCCWTCLECHNNEQIADNGTRCKLCPKFTWPDQEDPEWCLPISPDTIAFISLGGLMLLTFVALGLSLCLFVFGFYLRYRNHRIIKASSVGLSCLILASIALGYCTIIFFMGSPGTLKCWMGFMVMGMTFTLIYGPMLVRVQWVYRLFAASKKTTRRPRMSSMNDQFFFCFIIVALQGVIIVLSWGKSGEWYSLFESSRQDPYVELTCTFPQISLASSFFYNLLLIVFCGIFAFKARNLPSTFNESHFITVCVSVTFIISLGFIPTYEAAYSPVRKMNVLMAVLVLNHSVALVFLYLPKVYAVFYTTNAQTVMFNRSSKTIIRNFKMGSKRNPDTAK